MRIKLSNAFISVSLIFALFVSSEDLIPNIKSTKSDDIKSLMFVGHSFFYYNNSLHNHLGKLIKADWEDKVKAIAAELSDAAKTNDTKKMFKC